MRALLNKASLISVFLFALTLPSPAVGQSILSQQKQAVVFLFGTVHPVNPDKTPKKDAKGNPISLEMPLGTGFFVAYPDPRGGPSYFFGYLATAKHVLRDADGSFLHTVNVRINLKTPHGDSLVDFIKDFPVADADGTLLWYHGTNEVEEALAANCLPVADKVDFRFIPVSMFVDESILKSSDVEEGDAIYFVGLMAQFYGNKKNSPVVRHGTLALMTDEAIPSSMGPQRGYIAEVQSWPGNSGSPVFLSLGGMRHGSILTGENLKLLGIMLGDFVNKIPATLDGQQ